MQFTGTDSGKHSVVISSHDPENHTGVKPSDLLLLALGSCSAYDVVKILGKQKAGLSRCEITVSAEQENAPPYAFHSIHLHFDLSGENLENQSIERAIELSLHKYCSVAATLREATRLTSSFHVAA